MVCDIVIIMVMLAKWSVFTHLSDMQPIVMFDK